MLGGIACRVAAGLTSRSGAEQEAGEGPTKFNR
jgi:hypothetical protein